MALYTYRCPECGWQYVVSRPIDSPEIRPCCYMHDEFGVEMRRDYRADKPQPAAMWPEHFNPSTGTVVRDRKQLQSDLDRKAAELYERSGIEQSPVVIDRSDMMALRHESMDE